MTNHRHSGYILYPFKIAFGFLKTIRARRVVQLSQLHSSASRIKLIVLTVVFGFGLPCANAQVVAAWDFNASSATATDGWTSFSLGFANSSSVNGITLTQAKAGGWTNTTKSPNAIQERDTALLSAGSNEMNDGFDLSSNQAFTLTGLTAHHRYRLQFIGVVKFTADAQNRNLTLSTDIEGTSTASLLDYTTLLTGNNGGYSEYLPFITDASQEVVLTFGEENSGTKCVSGLIVEDLGYAEPIEPPRSPSITDFGIGETGADLFMTWRTKEGELFDVVKSTNFFSWINIASDIPASEATTQTTFSIELEEEVNSQFYQVWRSCGRPPNIILLFADDLGYGDLACYGHPYAKTPNLDRLAKQGTMFRKFNVTGVTCHPSRAGILSSWHPNSYQVSSETYGFNQAQYGGKDHPTIMELLNHAGYRTAHFGKWHIGKVHEWDTGVPGSGNEIEPVSGTYGIDVIDIMGGGGNDARGRDESIYKAAINFIEENAETNFYINVMGRVPHSPVDPRPELVERAGFDNLHTYFNTNDFSGTQIHKNFQKIIDAKGSYDGANMTNSMANYLTEVYYIDQFIGELLDKLDELNLTHNTIIAFSSDQGPDTVSYPEDDRTSQLNLVGWTGGLRGQKHDQHEGGVRTPFILRWPGYVPAGKINTKSTISSLDWLPTLCEITGVDISNIAVQGESILDIWKGADRSRNGPQFWNSSMKEGEWRAYFKNGNSIEMKELYDLSKDFGETNNLVDSRPDKVQELTALWKEWISSLP